MRSANAGDFAEATNTAATATLTNGENYTIAGIMLNWSYDNTPTGGKVQLKDGTTVIAEVDIVDAGAGFTPIAGYNSTLNNTLSAVLAAGGAGVTGKVSISGAYL